MRAPATAPNVGAPPSLQPRDRDSDNGAMAAPRPSFPPTRASPSQRRTRHRRADLARTQPAPQRRRARVGPALCRTSVVSDRPCVGPALRRTGAGRTDNAGLCAGRADNVGPYAGRALHGSGPTRVGPYTGRTGAGRTARSQQARLAAEPCRSQGSPSTEPHREARCRLTLRDPQPRRSPCTRPGADGTRAHSTVDSAFRPAPATTPNPSTRDCGGSPHWTGQSGLELNSLKV